MMTNFGVMLSISRMSTKLNSCYAHGYHDVVVISAFLGQRFHKNSRADLHSILRAAPSPVHGKMCMPIVIVI